MKSGRFYVLAFREAGVIKIGESIYGPEARIQYAKEHVQRFTGSTEDPVILLDVPASDAFAVESVWRLALREAGILPLWHRRDFFRLAPAITVMHTKAGFNPDAGIPAETSAVHSR